MSRQSSGCSRRQFLRLSAAVAAGAPLALSRPSAIFADAPRASGRDAKVAIVRCGGYGPEMRAALKEAFDLLGGIGSLVRNKTVTVKLNITGFDFAPVCKRPAGESYVTHFSTALALGGLLFDAGARRVRVVESTQVRASLEATLRLGEWDLQALNALGPVEFENTRNLGKGGRYAELKVPDGGRMFSRFLVNHSYDETDVLVSLCKLKQHVTAGVTLSMKNLFGVTPNALYGDEAPNENATAGRGVLHAGKPWAPNAKPPELPGMILKPAEQPVDPGVRVPRIITDIIAARPIHLAIIEGVSAMTGGEGPWTQPAKEHRLVKPGVIIAGLNPVSTDAVGAAVMGVSDPRVPRFSGPVAASENHILLAEKAGVGIADLARIDVRGLAIEKARCPYDAKG
ncbi:MAG: DUF362 domain-containing protein [Verrucomicrobia bacterium]|nr:DUF362 domain-containing protein [Verrucomicrobiota bacterium]